MPSLHIPTEEESATAKLLEKLDAWLRQQPEWLVLFAQDRNRRRRAADAVAKALYTVPTVEGQTLNRALKRQLTRTFEKGNR